MIVQGNITSDQYFLSDVWSKSLLIDELVCDTSMCEEYVGEWLVASEDTYCK